MLPITIPANTLWDESKEEFIAIKEQTLKLEHSLVSISKWEQKWHKPFSTNTNKTLEETMDYIRCMTLNTNVDPDIYKALTPENIKEIMEYIENPATATTVREIKKSGSKEIVTSELIYYWMIALNIPFECEKWHLNRLLMLIRVCNAKNDTGKKNKTSKKELVNRYAEMNAARRKQLNSKG